MISLIRKLFGKKNSSTTLEPLLLSNVDRIFEEWSKGFEVASLENASRSCDFCGSYAIKGRNPDKKEATYFGSLRLEAVGKIVKGYWEIGHSRAPQFGYGFVKGDLVALDFFYTVDGVRFYGQVIYKVVGDSLVGFWKEAAALGVGLEYGSLKNRL